ncbi:Kalirin [Manis pentadactyla]|nr:Kalirin [Manis pentadactyla]
MCVLVFPLLLTWDARPPRSPARHLWQSASTPSHPPVARNPPLRLPASAPRGFLCPPSSLPPDPAPPLRNTAEILCYHPGVWDLS